MKKKLKMKKKNIKKKREKEPKREKERTKERKKERTEERKERRKKGQKKERQNEKQPYRDARLHPKTPEVNQKIIAREQNLGRGQSVRPSVHTSFFLHPLSYEDEIKGYQTAKERPDMIRSLRVNQKV